MTPFTFYPNTTYEIRYIGDSTLKTPMTVTRRTEKSVWVRVRNEAETRLKVYNNGDSEYVLPFGNYSMSPACYAKNLHTNQPTPTPQVTESVETVAETVEEKENTVAVLPHVDGEALASCHLEILSESKDKTIVINETVFGKMTVCFKKGSYRVNAGKMAFVTTEYEAIKTFLSVSYKKV